MVVKPTIAIPYELAIVIPVSGMLQPQEVEVEYKLASKIQAGDRIVTEEGIKVVTEVTPGMYRRHVMIHWDNGWGSVGKGSQVEIAQ